MFNKKKNNSTKQPQTTAFDKLKAREIKDTTGIIGGPDPSGKIRVEIDDV